MTNKYISILLIFTLTGLAFAQEQERRNWRDRLQDGLSNTGRRLNDTRRNVTDRIRNNEQENQTTVTETNEPPANSVETDNETLSPSISVSDEPVQTETTPDLETNIQPEERPRRTFRDFFSSIGEGISNFFGSIGNIFRRKSRGERIVEIKLEACLEMEEESSFIDCKEELETLMSLYEVELSNRQARELQEKNDLYLVNEEQEQLDEAYAQCISLEITEENIANFYVCQPQVVSLHNADNASLTTQQIELLNNKTREFLALSEEINNRPQISQEQEYMNELYNSCMALEGTLENLNPFISCQQEVSGLYSADTSLLTPEQIGALNEKTQIFIDISNNANNSNTTTGNTTEPQSPEPAQEEENLTPLERHWRQLGELREPIAERMIERYLTGTGIYSGYDNIDITIGYNDEGVVGFKLVNTGSPNTNPDGATVGSRRSHNYLFNEGARENIHLFIYDDVKVSGRDSHDSMNTEVYFFPRTYLPSMRFIQDNSAVQVTLPTGEAVLYNAETMEIIGGALSEEPMDRSESRYTRNNPKVNYLGLGLTITIDQRGTSPREALVWGSINNRAEINYPSKYEEPCDMSPASFFNQSPNPGETSPSLNILFESDEDVYQVIEQECGWDLNELRIMNQQSTIPTV